MSESPEEVIRSFSESLSQGDVDAMVSLYEEDATFTPEPGRAVSGREAIREALEGFVAMSPRMEGSIGKVLVAGETALVTNHWTLRGVGPDGSPVELAGTSADVLRRRPDGAWRIAIDDPWGGEG